MGWCRELAGLGISWQTGLGVVLGWAGLVAVAVLVKQ